MLARGKSKTLNTFDRRTRAGPPGAGRIEEGFSDSSFGLSGACIALLTFALSTFSLLALPTFALSAFPIDLLNLWVLGAISTFALPTFALFALPTFALTFALSTFPVDLLNLWVLGAISTFALSTFALVALPSSFRRPDTRYVPIPATYIRFLSRSLFIL